MTDRPLSHPGIELGDRGWDQGSLFQIPSAEMSYLRVEVGSGQWECAREPVGQDDWLVVASQTCDIVKKPEAEPYVDVARAFWTDDRTRIRNASTNSVREYCLQRRTASEGGEEGLIVDATVRLNIHKASLLRLTRTPGFAHADRYGPIRFRQWLGRRYARDPLPDDLVRAVQKPIVDALQKLRPDNPHWDVLDGIDQIVFQAIEGHEPQPIEMFFIRSERQGAPVVNQTDVDRLAGWIANQLKRAGKAVLHRQELTDLHSISAYDFAVMRQLPLDLYSLPEITE